MNSVDDWSDAGSLTPPLSEFEEDENILDCDDEVDPSCFKRQKTEEYDETKFVPLFHCGGSQKLTSLEKGYIRHGFLARLLENKQPNDGLFKKSITTLFGFKFLTKTALVEQRKKLFYLLRQRVTEFESKQTDSGCSNYLSEAREHSWFYVNLRRECSCFFLYVITFIHRYHPVLECKENADPYIQCWTSFPSILKTELDNLWIFLGPISNLPNSCFLRLEDFSTSTVHLTPTAEWFHLHLELKWSILEVLSRLHRSHGMKSIDLLNEIEEKSLALLMDLVHISTHIILSTKSNTVVVKTSPFLCPCVKELWVIMINFLDFQSTNLGIKSFWSILTNVLTGILQPDNEQKNEFPFDVAQISYKNPVQFCWWLLVHVAQLYWYNDSGEYIVKENASVPGNWILVQDLLRLSFLSKDAKIQEDISRCYLNCCLQICQHWHPNNDVVLFLWDYFHKKMNDTFHGTGQGLQSMACTRDKPYQWFEQILNRCKDPSLSCENDTSYHLFLRIVASHLKRLKKMNSFHGWKQLKGRFYSKFHKKRMEELSEQGLLSFFNLFLTLANVGDFEDASNKMMSFLDLLDFKSLNHGRKLCVWKGYFVLLFLFKYKRTSMDYIAQKVAGIFTEICRNYKEFYKDRTQRHTFWTFISLYLECTQELLEYDNLQQLSDYKLIAEGFGVLFPICGEKELQLLVNFTQSMLVIVSNELQNKSVFQSAVCQALWQHIFPHIRQRIIDPFNSQICWSQMTNLIVSFTLLSIEHPPTMSGGGSLDTFHSLVQQFGTKDSMPASISCKFLGCLLASPQALELIQSSDYQSDIIHAWFRCCLQIASQEQHLQELTRAVFQKLPEMGNLIKVQRSVVAGNVETALSTFIKSLGEKFSSLELLTDTVAFREKSLVYFGDVLKYMESFIKQAGPLDLLRLSYKVAACLVKDCPKIIYKKTQHDCLLPQIIDQLILPLNAKKQLPHPITQCIKLNLTEFLEGLASLDFRRDEFIKRKIKQIFATYFHIFNQECYGSPSNSASTKNPFLEVLNATLSSNPSQDVSDFRQYVVTIIKEKYLVIPRLTKELTSTLFYLGDLFKRTILPKETARNTPLIIKNILLCLLACDTSNPGTEPPHIRREATTILKQMLDSCQKAPDVTARTALLTLLNDFLNSNLNQMQGAVFKVFTTIAKFDKELVVELIPSSKEAIIRSEKKRGVGQDTRLRTSFKSLLETLGPSGHNHMQDMF